MLHGKHALRYIVAAALATILLSGAARAQDDEVSGRCCRYEIWMGPTWWPALGELQPLDGRFDTTGLGIGFAFHVPFRKYENSDLLLGVDLSVSAADSNIDTFLSGVMARHLFLGVSGKWLFGPNRNLSLDAGFGYHEADIAEISTVVWGLENEVWSRSRAGAWVGVGWDLGRARPGRNGGLFIAAKAHFVDFGDVHDDRALSGTVLGSAAGQLDSPIYMLEIGYSGL